MNSTLEHQIAKYADHLVGLTAPVSESEILSRGRPATAGIRGGLIAAAAATLIITVIGAVAVLTQFGGHEQGPLTTPAPTSPPTTAPMETSTTLPALPKALFSWSDDDLAEWVTEAEMTDALQDVVRRYTGADLDGDALFEHEGADESGDEAGWTAGSWSVLFHNGDHDGRYVGPPTGTDPRLPQGVTYEAEWGFGHGFYILKGPNSDEMIAIHLLPPGRSYGYPGSSEVEAHEDKVFALASMMLQEMGWID